MNTTFCAKCRGHKPGGVGTGRQYRCVGCAAARTPAVVPAAQPEPQRLGLTLDFVLGRCEEYGECRLWSGPMSNGSPQVFNGGKEGKYIQARRFVHAETTGKPIRKGYYPVMKCREPGCLVFEHMTLLTAKQIGALAAQEGKFSSPQRRAAITRGRRASAPKLDIATAREIFNSPESGPVLAARHGIHRSLVSRIKKGEAWRQFTANSSVFNQAA